MSEVPSRNEALNFLYKVGCPQRVIEHSILVSRVALEIATKCERNGIDIDKELVEIGALLHDIGRSKTHGIQHAMIGARIARDHGFSDTLVKTIENHVGAGIPREEASKLNLPSRDFFPTSPEEKIITYADKISKDERKIEFKEVIQDFEINLGSNHPVIGRLKELRNEIIQMMGSEYP